MNSYMKNLGLLRMEISRRSFLKFGAAAAALMMTPRLVSASMEPDSVQVIPADAALDSAPERALSFYNTRTGEEWRRVYWCHGDYVPEALEEINHLLRDHRTNEIREIDPRLLDLLYDLNEQLNSRGPFQVVSAYRSPETNALLRRRSKRIARNSLHMEGMAVDIRLPDRSMRQLARAALSLKSGGVGYYPRRHFVHVDTGKVRRW
ncbi:MAG: DUF882 domain-containing protein [Deltaproteobacteria bacterium]|nr:DUF882 domain-containing protein [Deltaproteobacteria bacterium]